MNISLAYDRKRRPLLHLLCALALVFFVTIRPIVVAAETDVSQPVDQTITSEPAPPSPPAEQPPATDPAPEIHTPPADAPSPGPQAPTGADSSTFVYNEATGLWENDLYTWNPTTKQTKPKSAPNYSFNPATGLWDTTEWRYDAPSGTYVENPVSVSTPPADATLAAPTSSPTGDAPDSTSAPSLLSAPLLAGPGATSGVSTGGTSNGIFDLFHNAAISNTLTSNALTGDAAVARNTQAGDASSGDAVAIATILNLLQSSWGFLSQGELTTFVANLFGDLFGDIMIDPETTPQALATSTPPDSLTVNATGSGAITNDIDLDAQSGNATVDSNTSAGNATSGNAYALANIINSISSSISAGSSFLGVVNVFGDLDGDILLPVALMNLLGGSDTPSAPHDGDLSLTTDTNQVITNDVASDAATGEATVDRNTSAGTATSGNATNALTILNLTGRQIIGSNTLLVFVNVLGNWMGLIVDAPGATAAALGDAGATSHALPPGDYTLTDNQTIDNNISLRARSGNADVTNNTSAGNAATGDAVTAANILNITNSALALTDWFGVLFINIFGDWKGSFGVDTDAGEVPVATSGPAVADTSAATSSDASPIYSYSTTTFSTSLRSVSSVMSSDDDVSDQNSGILSIHDNEPSEHELTLSPASVAGTGTAARSSSPKVHLFSVIGTIIGLSILAAERTYNHRDRLKLRWAAKARTS